MVEKSPAPLRRFHPEILLLAGNFETHQKVDVNCEVYRKILGNFARREI
jgi:hypothetical protein